MKRLVTTAIIVITLFAGFFVADLNPVHAASASGTCGTCTWSYEHSTRTLTISAGEMDTWDKEPPWYYYNKLVEKIVIEGPIVLQTGYKLFDSCSQLRELDVSEFDTSHVTNMESMFSGCYNLSKLDVSKFDTSNVTNMKSMFNSCAAESLDVSNFDTSHVTNMEYMFYGCSILSKLDVSNFDTSNVPNMHYMFGFCKNIKSLDVSNFDTSKVNDMGCMFRGMSALQSLDLSNFDTSNVQNMVSMFYDCSSLESLDVHSFDTSKVTAMNEMFWGCSALTSLDLRSFNTNENTDGKDMFYKCDSLKKLRIGDWTSMMWQSTSRPQFPVAMRDITDQIDYEAGDEIPKVNNHTFIAGDEDPEESLTTLNRSSAKVAVGKTLTLEASGPDDITFKSSKKAVAKVSSAGLVTAVKPGTATITAYSKSDPSNKATCKITVKYKLTYKMDGGTNSASNPVWYTGTVKLKDPKARKGYDFKGWYSNSTFKTRVKSVKNANKTLYAKWEWHAYSIKFVKNGGTGSQYYQRCRYGKEFNLPACKYTRKGYTFTGWNTKQDGSGKAYADQASFKNLTSVDNKTIPFYAQWKLKKYTIKYPDLPHGAKNANKTSYTITTSTFDLKNASCAGYDFKGWFSNSTKTTSIKRIAKGSTGNKTIYSKWTPHKYTIKFNANDGTGKMASLTSRKYGQEYILPANSFKKADFVFAGWNTKKDGSGTVYADGAKVSNLVTKDGGSITLFAQWKPAFVPRDTLDGLNAACLNRAVAILDVSLPNCTTYALARALEITHYDPATAPNYIPPFIVPGHSDAKYFWENNLNSANPYPTGTTPKVGAIAVWSNGGSGHVAIVEHIENGVVYYSHSNYGGFGWEPSAPYPGSMNTSTFHCEAKEINGEVKWGFDLTLLGYIYLTD